MTINYYLSRTCILFSDTSCAIAQLAVGVDRQCRNQGARNQEPVRTCVAKTVTFDQIGGSRTTNHNSGGTAIQKTLLGSPSQ